MPELRYLILIWDVIVVLWFSTHTVFNGVSSDVTGYEYSLVMILAQIRTGQRCFTVCHWVTVAFLTPLLCVQNFGNTFMLGVWSRCCEVAHAIYCRTWCLPSAGCVFVYSPLWGLWSTSIIACQKILSWLVVLWMWSGGSAVSCKYGTLAWMGWLSVVSWGGGPLFLSPVVVAGG